jgi:hypothetical protein
VAFHRTENRPMGISCERPSQFFRWHIFQWNQMFALACARGWMDDDVATLTEEQAQHLADLLEASLPQISDENTIPIDAIKIATIGSDTINLYFRGGGSAPREEIEPSSGIEGLADFHGIEDPSGTIRMYCPVRWVGEEVWLMDPERPLTPWQTFSGENKADLVDFIAFCRQGGFVARSSEQSWTHNTEMQGSHREQNPSATG